MRPPAHQAGVRGSKVSACRPRRGGNRCRQKSLLGTRHPCRPTGSLAALPTTTASHPKHSQRPHAHRHTSSASSKAVRAALLPSGRPRKRERKRRGEQLAASAEGFPDLARCWRRGVCLCGRLGALLQAPGSAELSVQGDSQRVAGRRTMVHLSECTGLRGCGAGAGSGDLG